MHLAGLSGQLKRRRGKTTIRVQGVRTAPDLVGRDFNPTAINRLWAADITYIEAFYNRRRRHSTLGMLSPLDFENGTLRDDGAALAASRLASINQINYKSTSTAQAA